jgi:hypothetical protein
MKDSGQGPVEVRDLNGNVQRDSKAEPKPDQK